MTRPDSARARVTRSIAADPTSTALLLAGPAAMDLWPGLRRVGEAAGQVLVETELAQGTAAGGVRARPPRRTPTAYVTRFQTSGPGLPDASGTLTLGYLPSADAIHFTEAALEVEADGLRRSGLSETSLQALVTGFLDNLADAAEARSRAA